MQIGEVSAELNTVLSDRVDLQFADRRSSLDHTWTNVALSDTLGS